MYCITILSGIEMINEKCRGTLCGIFVCGEMDGHCAFQILPQLVTELREMNNRPIPFSEESLAVTETKEPWDED